MDAAGVSPRHLPRRTSRLALGVILVVLGALITWMMIVANRLKAPVLDSTVEEYLRLKSSNKVVRIKIHDDEFEATFRDEIQRNGVFYKRVRFSLPKGLIGSPASAPLTDGVPPDQVDRDP